MGQHYRYDKKNIERLKLYEGYVFKIRVKGRTKMLETKEEIKLAMEKIEE
jgi:hypothetical protein